MGTTRGIGSDDVLVCGCADERGRSPPSGPVPSAWTMRVSVSRTQDVLAASDAPGRTRAAAARRAARGDLPRTGARPRGRARITTSAAACATERSQRPWSGTIGSGRPGPASRPNGAGERARRRQRRVGLGVDDRQPRPAAGAAALPARPRAGRRRSAAPARPGSRAAMRRRRRARSSNSSAAPAAAIVRGRAATLVHARSASAAGRRPRERARRGRAGAPARGAAAISSASPRPSA